MEKEDINIKKLALGQHLGLDIEYIDDEINESSYDDCLFKYGKEEYLVCTDDEADDRQDEWLESYIDDCVLCELPEIYRNYFDRDSFKYDCTRDGRGHSLSSYDGEENEEEVDGETFYIYRTN